MRSTATCRSTRSTRATIPTSPSASPRRRPLGACASLERVSAMKIYDISRVVSEDTPVWPGDVPFSWRDTAGSASGGPWGSTCFTMSAHCGTHADAPGHVFGDGATIGEAPLAAYIGPARVIELAGVGEVGPDALPRRSVGAPRILF